MKKLSGLDRSLSKTEQKRLWVGTMAMVMTQVAAVQIVIVPVQELVRVQGNTGACSNTSGHCRCYVIC